MAPTQLRFSRLGLCGDVAVLVSIIDWAAFFCSPALSWGTVCIGLPAPGLAVAITHAGSLASDFLEQSAAQIGVADACSNERRTDAISSLTTLVFLLCIFFSSYFTVKVNGSDVTGAYIAVPALVAVTTQLPAELPVISSVFAIVQGPVTE